VGVRTPFALGLAALLLAGCARSDVSAPTATPSTGARTVGYVRLDVLVKKHPLYDQLARYDQNIEALSLRTIVPQAIAAGPKLAAEEAALQKQLDEAMKRTNDLLQQKSRAYQDRESAAIAEAMRASSGSGGRSAGAIAAQVERTAQGQVSGAAAQAQHDLDTYRKQLEAQDGKQIDALQQTLAARADRTYRAKVDELQAKEAALSLKLATDDSADRLLLRTRLSSLALDETTREQVKSRLDALDRKESDALAAQRNLDQQTLSALQTELRDSVRTELTRQVAQIHQRSLARLQARQQELRTQFSAPSGPLIGTTIQNGKQVAQVNPNLPAALREKIQRLHDDYAKAFQRDAGATIADFNKTREDLKKRYDALHGINEEAARSVQSEIASLQKKREGLYDQMVAQIGREVKTIAQQRGISVVLTNVTAGAGGVDLTDDAMKDIESLHE
jgi:hypothetical protein